MFREGLEQREKGTKAYKENDWEAAIDSWCMSRGTFKHIIERKFFEEDPDKLAEVKNILLSVHLNLAQGHLKNGEFYQAVGDCDRAMEIDPCNTKALYRKAAGQNNGSQFPEARETLGKLLELDPDN